MVAFCCKRRSKCDILGKPMVFKEAPEPTNIIWENRHIKSNVVACRCMGVFFFIFLTLFGASALFFFMKKFVI